MGFFQTPRFLFQVVNTSVQLKQLVLNSLLLIAVGKDDFFMERKGTNLFCSIVLFSFLMVLFFLSVKA